MENNNLNYLPYQLRDEILLKRLSEDWGYDIMPSKEGNKFALRSGIDYYEFENFEDFMYGESDSMSVWETRMMYCARQSEKRMAELVGSEKYEIVCRVMDKDYAEELRNDM